MSANNQFPLCTVFIMIFNNIYILWIIFLAVIPAMNCEEICDSTSDYGFDYYDQTANILCGHDDFERILDTNSNLDSSKHCCLFGEQIGYVYKDTCKVYSTFNLFVFQKLLQNIVTKYLLISYIAQDEWLCAFPKNSDSKAQKILDCPKGCDIIDEDLDDLKEKYVPGMNMININVTENVRDHCWTYFCPGPRFEPGWVPVRSKYCYCNNSVETDLLNSTNDPYLSGFNFAMMLLNIFLSIFI